MKNKLLILIIVLAAFLRFYHLSSNPPSLNWDETSNGYNAYSILKTARDEYGNFLPLTIRSFGDYNMPLSVYLLIPSIAFFGLTEVGVRFPSALLGTLSVLFTYFLVLKLSQKRIIALISAALLAISPWHLQFSRYDHEANFMSFFAIVGLTLFFASTKKFRYLVLSAISFVLALNSYHAAKIWLPALFLILSIFYIRQLLPFGKKLIIILAIFIIGSVPILLNFNNSLIRAQSVGVIGQKTPVQLFISGYLSEYNLNFLFTNGDNIGRHSVPGMGELYIFELPFLLAGLIYLIYKKPKNWKFVIGWLAIAGFAPAIATPTPHALRGLTFLPVWQTITAFGFYAFVKSKVSKIIKFSLCLTVLVVGFYNISTYLHLYYSHYPKEKATDWQYGYKQMINYVDSVKEEYSSVAITNYYGNPYIFTLFYSQFEPTIYQKNPNKEAFDKFEFFGASWGKTKEGPALVVTPPWQAHPDNIVKQIYAPNGDLVFTISKTL